MPAPAPTVGRIVHYVSHGTPFRPDGTQAYGQKCRAAVVTDDCPESLGPDEGENGPCVSLAVLNPTGMFFPEHVEFDGGRTHAVDPQPGYLCDEHTHRGGTWHWPAGTREARPDVVSGVNITLHNPSGVDDSASVTSAVRRASNLGLLA